MKEEPQWDRVPAKVQRLLQRCLEKDPERRLRDIGDAMELVDEAPRVAAAEVRGGSGATGCGRASQSALRPRGGCGCSVARSVARIDARSRAHALSSPVAGESIRHADMSPGRASACYYGLTTGSGMSLLVRDMGGADWRLLASVENVTGHTDTSGLPTAGSSHFQPTVNSGKSMRPVALRRR